MSTDQFELPRYRVVRAVFPSPNSRHRLESPFSKIFDSSIWQQAERPFVAGEVIETTEWPHPSFRTLNEPAKRVMNFFNTRMKSRLPVSPYRHGVLHLDDGLTGPSEPQFSLGRAGDAA